MVKLTLKLTLVVNSSPQARTHLRAMRPVRLVRVAVTVQAALAGTESHPYD